jgi:hypothetical protein
MKTFQVKCKVANKEELKYLWGCSDEFSEYYNSMLTTLRIDYEIKSEWPKECRTYLSKYELQKHYGAKAMGIKPQKLLSYQIIGISDILFNSIKSFYTLKKTNKNANFPFKEKKFDLFNPLYFSFNKTSKNILIRNDNEIELTFQNHKKINLKCIYNNKHQLSKLKLRPEGHKLIYKNGSFYFHFCIDNQKKLLPITNKSIFIDLGQKDLVVGFCPETKSIIKVSGKQLVNQNSK